MSFTIFISFRSSGSGSPEAGGRQSKLLDLESYSGVIAIIRCNEAIRLQSLQSLMF